MYVDDCLATGTPGAVESFLKLVSDTWKTKMQGFLSRDEDVVLKIGDAPMEPSRC